ncbi:hypothetical protein SISSUDRAFT_1068039 [Sistotremastrum suecicum HHB10207 ss-3]|uniref:Uncharacterized protein n=1 Tax=Sistotremastrum suecicum HHB10207 ss-3 TaxID=1314776 RepID=A0A165WH26_9AGAM|nr:hypothetical protein SISSUDRAFT_1068039 [Sistotremastrum suecicum HHB10207 ss-3]
MVSARSIEAKYHYHRPGLANRFVGLPRWHPLNLWKRIREDTLSVPDAAALQASSRYFFKDGFANVTEADRPWAGLTRTEKVKVIEEAMTHIKNNHRYIERYANSCTITLVASLDPIDLGLDIADCIHVDSSSQLKIATLLPHPPHGLEDHDDVHLQRIEEEFSKLARVWFSRNGRVTGDNESSVGQDSDVDSRSHESEDSGAAGDEDSLEGSEESEGPDDSEYESASESSQHNHDEGSLSRSLASSLPGPLPVPQIDTPAEETADLTVANALALPLPTQLSESQHARRMTRIRKGIQLAIIEKALNEGGNEENRNEENKNKENNA